MTMPIDDPIILELLPGYVKRRKLEIFQLQRLVEDNEHDKIRLIGHNLKGSGGLYGLQKISDFGADLEEAALASDNTLLTQQIAEMQAYLEELNF